MFITLTKKQASVPDKDKVCLNINFITYVHTAVDETFGTGTAIGQLGGNNNRWYVEESQEEVMAMINEALRCKNNTPPTTTGNRLSGFVGKIA